MIHQPALPWECRLCAVKHRNREYMHQHLRDAHGIPQGLDGDLRLQLHASEDHPEFSKKTFGYYQVSRLVALHIRVEERAADDPMRLGG